jgi:hypothetical protein
MASPLLTATVTSAAVKEMVQPALHNCPMLEMREEEARAGVDIMILPLGLRMVIGLRVVGRLLLRTRASMVGPTKVSVAVLPVSVRMASWQSIVKVGGPMAIGASEVVGARH